MLTLLSVKRRLAMPGAATCFVLSRALPAFGAALTSFALDVWVYRQTGSYALFATIAVVAALPGLVFAPFAGVAVDRLPRRALLIACDATCILTMLGVALAAQAGMLSVPLVAAAVALLGLARTVSWPASAATLPLLASDRVLARGNGLTEALEGGIGIVSPLLGALAAQTVGVAGVALCDMLLTGLSILTLLRLPLTQSDTTKASPVGLRAWRADATFGFRWSLARPSLLRLQLFFVAINLGCSVYVVGYGAYLMSFAPTGLLGLCLAAGGAGTVAGGFWFATTGGLRRHEQGVLAGALLMSAAMLAAGLARSPTVLFAMAFVDGFTLPLINASSQTIWQARVPVDLQGRVFAIRKMIAWGLNPLSILISIPFVTRVFAPLVEDGALSHWWGNGTAGALGLMLSSCGALCLAATLPLWLTDGLRDRDPPLPQTP